MEITIYELSLKISHPIRCAIVADLHDSGHYREVLYAVAQEHPDIILSPGDLMHSETATENGFHFLEEAVRIAPVFFSLGNHERLSEEGIERIRMTGATLLRNEYTHFGEFLIGGLTSGKKDGGHVRMFYTPPPDLEWLRSFSELDGPKLLLSHHPEYYPRYLRSLPIDVIVSGHAHGGQWRIGTVSLFAPGQGFFPKYTAGVTDGRLVVSRGLSNRSAVPRINNPAELVILDLIPAGTDNCKTV